MKFRGWFEGTDEIMRKIIVKLHGLSPDQLELENYDRCYNSKLFDDRKIDWSMMYNQYNGTYINKDFRKPHFQDPIGKEIIDSVSAFIFGSDKFPTIAFKAMSDVYDEDLVERAIEKGEIESEKVDEMSDIERRNLEVDLCNEELHKFSSGVLTSALLNLPMLDGTRKALIGGYSVAVPKVLEGEYYIDVIHAKNIRNMKMDPVVPNKIISFSEMYMFEDTDPDKPTDKAIFWYRRDFTDKGEIVYKPIKEHSQKGLPESFKWEKDGKKSISHNLGFCPAILLKAPNGRSLFYGQIENIKSYTYLTSNIYNGIQQDMTPQWAVMFDQEAQLNYANFAPKMRGGMWAFMGAKSLQSIAPSSGGYDSAREFRKELKKDIMKACRLDVTDSADSRESSTSRMMRMAPTMDAIGEYRICFGEHGLQKLCEMIIKIAMILKKRGESIVIKNGALVPDGDNFICSLGWGEKMPITEDSIMKAITNSLTAYKGGLVDLEHAVQKIAPFFNVIDVEEMLKKLREKMDDVVGGEDAAQMYGRLVNKIGKGNKKLSEKGVKPVDEDPTKVNNRKSEEISPQENTQDDE